MSDNKINVNTLIVDMKYKLLLVIFFIIPLLTIPQLKADSEFELQWSRTYGWSNIDRGLSFQQTQDRGYVITGSARPSGIGSDDVFLIKTDSTGNEIWQRTYGGPDADRGHSVQQTKDGGFIVAGITWSFGAGKGDVYLIKTDSHGEILWNRTYGGNNNDYGFSVLQTEDNGFIILGMTGSFGAESQAFLIKTDSEGNELWSRTYGGSSRDYGHFISQTTDSGYILVGYTTNFPVGGSANFDVYLIKTDSKGNELWSNRYGGLEDEEGQHVLRTIDGGYFITGRTKSYGNGDWDIFTIKTDSNGSMIWNNTYGGSNLDWGYSAQQTQDGGYIIVGLTYSFGEGNQDIYIIKIDESGNKVWAKTVGGPKEDIGYFIQEISLDEYVIIGETHSFGAGGADVYFVKICLGIPKLSISLVEPSENSAVHTPTFLNAFVSSDGKPVEGVNVDYYVDGDLISSSLSNSNGSSWTTVSLDEGKKFEWYVKISKTGYQDYTSNSSCFKTLITSPTGDIVNWDEFIVKEGMVVTTERADQNWGYTFPPVFLVRSHPWFKTESYLKYDLSEVPKGAIIYEAELELKTYEVYEPAFVSVVYCLNNSWRENMITWNNKPTTLPWPISTADVFNAEFWYRWDVKNHVEISLDGDSGEYYLTLVLTIVGEQVGHIAFRDYWTTPTLKVYWIGPPPLGTLNIIVQDKNGNSIPNAIVSTISKPDGQSFLTGTSGSDGLVTYRDVKMGAYIFQSSKNGYVAKSGSVSAKAGEISELTITLEKEASPEKKKTTGGIPGFPFESIIIGIMTGFFILRLYQRRQ